MSHALTIACTHAHTCMYIHMHSFSQSHCNNTWWLPAAVTHSQGGKKEEVKKLRRVGGGGKEWWMEWYKGRQGTSWTRL